MRKINICPDKKARSIGQKNICVFESIETVQLVLLFDESLVI